MYIGTGSSINTRNLVVYRISAGTADCRAHWFWQGKSARHPPNQKGLVSPLIRSSEKLNDFFVHQGIAWQFNLRHTGRLDNLMV